jgi:hypothetical protein
MTDQPGRSYQQILIDQANAEMGRQRVSRRELARITGIHRNTLDRLFLCERDLNVTQWDAIASALGFEPGALAKMAQEAAVARKPSTDSGVHPEAERMIDASDQLTKRQRSAMKTTLRGDISGGRQVNDGPSPGESLDLSARRRGRAGAG